MSSPALTRSKSIRLAAVLAGLTIGLTACGGDDSDDETSASSSTPTTSTSTDAASTEDVTVTADEYNFDLSATPGADTKTVEFTNDGEEFHVFIFAKINEGYTVDEAVKLEGKEGSAVLVGQDEAKPGQTVTVDVKGPLEPGHYAMLCPLQTKDGEQHYKLGQLQEFDIEG